MVKDLKVVFQICSILKDLKLKGVTNLTGVFKLNFEKINLRIILYQQNTLRDYVKFLKCGDS